MAAKRVWRGAQKIEKLLVPIDDVKLHPQNPRRGDVPSIVGSLERFGQLVPLVVWKQKGYVVAGNHRLLAARELGWTHIAVVEVELEKQEADAYLLADNRTSDLGRYDDDARLKLLRSLSDRGRLAGTGYSPDDVEDLMSRRRAILEAEREDFAGGYSDDDAELQRRGERAGPGVGIREVILPLREEQFEHFGQWVKMLRKEYGTESITETVYEAVKRQAEAL